MRLTLLVFISVLFSACCNCKKEGNQNFIDLNKGISSRIFHAYAAIDSIAASQVAFSITLFDSLYYEPTRFSQPIQAGLSFQPCECFVLSNNIESIEFFDAQDLSEKSNDKFYGIVGNRISPFSGLYKPIEELVLDLNTNFFGSGGELSLSLVLNEQTTSEQYVVEVKLKNGKSFRVLSPLFELP